MQILGECKMFSVHVKDASPYAMIGKKWGGSLKISEITQLVKNKNVLGP